jgi:hypothetical protein
MGRSERIESDRAKIPEELFQFPTVGPDAADSPRRTRSPRNGENDVVVGFCMPANLPPT